MTIDKNNTKNLVNDIDADPTAELEILTYSLQSKDADQELEADASTYNCEDDNDDRDSPPGDIASLKRSIRERDQSIAHLQFDLEQLRARWTGLETEIKVREKLTDNVNAELRKARNDLAAMQKTMRGGQARAELLESKIADDAKTAEDNSKRIESLRIETDQRDRQIAELELQQVRYEQQFVEMRDQFAAMQLESTVRVQEHGLLDSQLRDASAKLMQADNRISTLSEQLAGKDAASAKQSAEMELLRQQLGQSNADLAKLKQISADVHGVTSNPSQGGDTIGHADLSAGQFERLVESRQEIRELQSQVSRTEGYADALRNKLQNQTRIADEATRSRQQTDMALADARQQVAELGRQVEIEKLSNTSLCEQLDEMRSAFEVDISRIQFELAAAQRTISDHETIQEQLTADLFDSQSFRQVLESQLEKSEVSSESLIRTLHQNIKRLEHQHEDDRHKISNKDGAIAALLSELANRSSTAKGVSEMDNAIPGEPAIEPDINHDDKSTADRITRLLIGNVDGQELRFPLFKDKLTIGRTRNNDIHLKAQSISRRHALIVTENDRTRIVDWGSKNGIAVNRQPVSEQVLRSGDIVTIGNADFRYEERPKR
jgi:chromosome segregation ATPase